MRVESALESLINISGNNKISKKSLTEITSNAVSVLRSSFTELKSALEKMIAENIELMET